MTVLENDLKELLEENKILKEENEKLMHYAFLLISERLTYSIRLLTDELTEEEFEILNKVFNNDIIKIKIVTTITEEDKENECIEE